MTARRPFDWAAWVAARKQAIQDCRTPDDIATFKQAMELIYASTPVPAEHRQAITTALVEHQREMEKRA